MVQQVSLDEAGAEAGCAVLDSAGDLVIGRDEAFYFNTLDGRGPCFACEGQYALLGMHLVQSCPHSSCNEASSCSWQLSSDAVQAEPAGLDFTVHLELSQGFCASSQSFASKQST